MSRKDPDVQEVKTVEEEHTKGDGQGKQRGVPLV